MPRDRTWTSPSCGPTEPSTSSRSACDTNAADCMCGLP
jgi:hypothetical protein